MPLKYLPPTEDWKHFAKTYKVKDNGLTKAIDEFWTRRDDEFEKGLAQLPKILKLATDLKKSKETVAAGPNAVKYIGELIDVVPTVRKDLEGRKKEFAKSAMPTKDVQITIVDWNGMPMSSDYEAYVEFTSPGTPAVNTTEKIKKTGVEIDNLRLRPSGAMYLMVREPSSAVAYCEGTTDYEFNPGKPVMKFKAIQHNKVFKVKARTYEEAAEKLGIKGSLNFEFKIVTVNGEKTKESEFKKGFEQEVEWEVEAGLPTIKDIRQLP
jgi:hypothetical protein